MKLERRKGKEDGGKGMYGNEYTLSECKSEEDLSAIKNSKEKLQGIYDRLIEKGCSKREYGIEFLKETIDKIHSLEGLFDNS